MEELLKAISHGKPWLDQFNRCDYEKTFAQYRALYEAAYVSAVQTADSTEELAQHLLDALENSWKRERFWNRKIAQVNDKMMLVIYLTPLLLGTQEPLCTELASVLCTAWKQRFPKNGYVVSDYDKIVSGFRNTVMGVELGDRGRDKP